MSRRYSIYLRGAVACLAATSFEVVAHGQTNLFVGALKQNVVFEFSSFDDVIFTETTFTSILVPEIMAFDSSGNLFVSNGSAKTIKKVTPSGIKTTFASGVDAAGMAFDRLGNLFVSQRSKDTDASEGVILKFAPDGSSTVFASNLSKPQGLAFDSVGNLYVADPVHGAILKISSDGRQTVFASGFAKPHRLAFDAFGDLYVTDTGANTIAAVFPSGVVIIIEEFGADSTSGGTINDLAFDSAGNLFVTFADSVIEFPGGVDVDETTVASVPGGAGGIAVAPPLATNLSTRVSVQGGTTSANTNGEKAALAPGSGAAIAGFIISGSGPRKVLIRGLGPTLSKLQIANALQDPTLDLTDANGNPIASNDDWQSATNASEIPVASQPGDVRESAILTTLQPGRFTAILRGKNQSGIALVEINDLSDDTSSRLSNVSTRGFVGTGDNVMIAGLMLTGGNGQRRVLIRALGPSLAQSPINLANSLPDPTLMLVDANGSVVGSNDDWKSSQAAEIQATGLTPLNDRESAILANLPAGNFTAIVSGKNGSTGLALVDVFDSF